MVYNSMLRDIKADDAGTKVSNRSLTTNNKKKSIIYFDLLLKNMKIM